MLPKMAGNDQNKGRRSDQVILLPVNILWKGCYPKFCITQGAPPERAFFYIDQYDVQTVSIVEINLVIMSLFGKRNCITPVFAAQGYVLDA